MPKTTIGGTTVQLRDVRKLSFNASLNTQTAVTSVTQAQQELTLIHEWVRAYGSDLQRSGVKDYVNARATSAKAELIGIELGPLLDQLNVVLEQSQELMEMIKGMESEA